MQRTKARSPEPQANQPMKLAVAFCHNRMCDPPRDVADSATRVGDVIRSML